jgi:hypothetical protein
MYPHHWTKAFLLECLAKSWKTLLTPVDAERFLHILDSAEKVGSCYLKIPNDPMEDLEKEVNGMKSGRNKRAADCKKRHPWRLICEPLW